MLSISKALSSGQAQTYHKMEFTSGTQSYYKQDGAVEGEWQGQLAAKMGLSGVVTAAEFTRLTQGEHPETGDVMVKHREGKEYKNADGETTKPVEHRAGWDATFSAPKSVSLTALVGGDERVREAHSAAVTAALTELERYTQARIGGNNPAETTGKLIAAKFEHDTARPVDGYAAPQLHTHVFIMNVTEREDGTTRALQPQSLFDTQNYATAVYQSALTYQLRNLGYEIEAGKSGAPEIKGYSQEYLDASSPRSQQIKEHLAKSGYSGAEASQIAAHATRDKKQILSPEEVIEAHRTVAATFGDQPATVVREARVRAKTHARNQDRTPEEIARAKEAVTYSRSSNFEREAVTDERTLMRDALRRGMGETTFAHVKAEFDARHSQGDFRELKGEKHATGRSFTTPETIANERANIRHVIVGQNAVEPIMNPEQAAAQAARRAFLNEAQRTVIQEVLTSPDRIHGVQGLAGTGKTTVLASIREGAEAIGYKVEGFAPTSRAAGQLRQEGIEATTLQSFLARQQQDPSAPASRHLYMLDESSLASTKQMRAFLEKIEPEDRVLVIGDTAQHQGVDAGRPFEQMQDAGMRTSQLDQIVRQRKNPALLEAVRHLAKGETAEGIKMLAEQGRVTQIVDPNERIAAIAKDYARAPENTLIVSPDNRSRQRINDAVRGELKIAGKLGPEDQTFSILAHRSDMTGADREWAARYKAGDVLKYETGSKAHGIARNSTATVVSTDARNNTVTIQQEDGQAVTYDPKRFKGVNVYSEIQKDFAAGDRIQFTAKDKKLGVNNRDLGTITQLEDGQITVLMEGKTARTLQFDPAKMRHFEHGYAVTSHVSQGLTEGRVIANIDTDSARSLINTRLAYVSISRAEHDARIYTNDAETLGARLATNVSKTAAVDFRRSPEPASEVRKEARTYEYADPNHRLAAVVSAFAERPANTVVIAKDRAERCELNQLIRADLQATGTVAPDSKALPVRIEQVLTNPKNATQYTPGDIIEYKQGSPKLEGIPNGSTAVVVSTDPRYNQLTVKLSHGDEVTYCPHLTKAMTAQSKVYREELQEFAQGDRVRLTKSVDGQDLRKGDFGTITAVNDGIELRLDKGPAVKLTANQAQHIEHGYAVDSLKNGAPERILISQDSSMRPPSYLAHLSRTGRDVSLYTSDGYVQTIAPPPSIAMPDQLKLSIALPEQKQSESPSLVNAPENTPAVQHRRSQGR